MNTFILKRDLYFYPLVFVVWGAFIIIRNMDYSFYSPPLPSVSGEMSFTEAMRKQGVIDKNIEELQKDLVDEKDVIERGHIEHNIGTAYYDRYKSSSRPDLIDSARAYYEKSIVTVPTVARFYYNLGRVFTERRDHFNAKVQYEKALQLSPDHVLALHNLALLNFYELGNKDAAGVLLTRALLIQPNLPICNYVLGEIELQQNHFEQALGHFQREVNTFLAFSGSRQNVPVSGSAMRFAASKSYYGLAILYSTSFPDAKIAQANFHACLQMENDQRRRDEIIAEMKKYWVVKSR